MYSMAGLDEEGEIRETVKSWAVIISMEAHVVWDFEVPVDVFNNGFDKTHCCDYNEI